MLSNASTALPAARRLRTASKRIALAPAPIVAELDRLGRVRDVTVAAVAVAADDPEFGGVNDISDLPPHRFREIKQFLKDYKPAPW